MNEPTNPKLISVVRRLKHLTTQDDPFCCASEAADFAYGILEQLKEAGITDPEMDEAETWLKNFSSKIDIDYWEVLDAARHWIWGYEDSLEVSSEHKSTVEANAKEFWEKVELVIDESANGETDEFFEFVDE